MKRYETLPVILYAEDNPNDVALMERAFAKAGMAEVLRTVSDGQEAINYLSGTGIFSDREKFPEPVLLMIDLNMPKKSGFDVLRWVRNRSKFESLPTVVLTASEADPDIKRAYRLGANSYLVKPPTLAKITALAQNLGKYWLTLSHVPQRMD